MENEYNGLEIAVIGISCSFPKSKNKEIFWENLVNGKELISFYSDKELEEAGISKDLFAKPNYVKAQSYLDDCDTFDAPFFGYSPDEAEAMDPQIRKFCEQSWKALEDAGYVPDNYKGAIGVYAGASGKFNWEASKFIKEENTWENLQLIDKDHIATRIAYTLNLKGPAITLSTACSTSLVAVNSACYGILTGQCEMALAGGVTIHPEKAGYIYQEGMISSSDGHNRTFDKDAEGTIGGSGVGVVVLKRLEDAIQDGDNIYAIIKGVSINNDGERKVGFTAPSIEGQAEAVKSAIQMADIEPESVGFVECHGTATNLGDPVEVEGLKLAFNTPKKNYCAIGSVKSNVGHLDSAAGIIGFIKAVLCLKNRMLVPSLHFKSPNPKMDLENSPFYVNTQTKQWENKEYPLRAGVSSFGVGGTNAHAILEEPPKENNSDKAKEFNIITITGKSRKALEENTENLKQYFKDNPSLNLTDVAYTLNKGREHFPMRRMLICKRIEDFIETENVYIKGKHNSPQNAKIVFMFSGQGAQYVDMGKGLYETEPLFKKYFDECRDILKKKLQFDIKEILFAEDKEEGNKIINQVLYTQPVKFSFEYSLAKLLIHKGVTPDYLIGHSFGEVGAACLAGVFSLNDALDVVAARAKLMESVPPGLMMSVNAPEEIIRKYLEEYSSISLAAVNGKEMCIVSGTIDDIESLEKVISEDEYDTLILKVPRAGHSGMMNPIIEEYENRISKLELHEPKIPYISGLTGDWIKPEQATNANYWSKHLRETIRFADGIAKLLENKDTVFIQLGPDRGLTSFVELHEMNTTGEEAINLIRHKKESIDDNKYLAVQLGEIWLKGGRIDWDKYYHDDKRKIIPLPTYEFDKYKFESKVNLNDLIGSKLEEGGARISKRRKMNEWFYTPSWEKSISLNKQTEIINEKTILIFSNESIMCNDLVSGLKMRGCEVVEIIAGDKFENINANRLSVNPNDEESYNEIINHFKNQNKQIDKIIYLWSFERDGCDEEYSNEKVLTGYTSILNIVKYLTELLKKQPGIITVSNGSYCITEEEELVPQNSMLGTLMKVISQEYPDIYTKQIDIDSKSSDVNKLMREILTLTKEKIVAYRKNIRYTESYKLLEYEEQDRSGVLKSEGVYLITGGLGNIGLDIGMYLGEEYKAKLIFIVRSDFPEKKDWNRIIREEGSSEVAKKVVLLNGIEEAGGTVIVKKTDITSSENLGKIFDWTIDEFGEINGVFHLSGITDQDYFTPLAETNEKITKAHFNSKPNGILALKQLLPKYNIDFVLVTSSVSAILGGINFGAYACANAYMDGVISKDLSNSNNPWINVNLDGWISERNNENANKQSDSYVTTSEGIKLIENLLLLKEYGVNTIVQSICDFNERLNDWGKNILQKSYEHNKDVIGDTGENTKVQLYPRPELTTDYVGPESDKENRLANIWSSFFRYEKIGINDDFFELGGNSLKAMRLLSVIYNEFGVRIKVKEIFKKPTIAMLAELINENTEEFVI